MAINTVGSFAMKFAIFTFIVAITIAMVAAWFSIVGLMAIFAAAAIPVAIMAGSLEIGKLVAASWVYRNWKRAPFLLKSYLTVATIVLMFITSMGIFGFLSRAHLEQAAEGAENSARIERIINDIARYEATVNRAEEKIVKLESQSSNDISSIQSQIDAEQRRMDSAYERIQPAIDEQQAIIDAEMNDGVSLETYTDQITKIDETLQLILDYVANDEIRKLQALIGVRVDGNYGTRTAAAVERFRGDLEARKAALVERIEESRNREVDSAVIDATRAEIKRLRDGAEEEIKAARATIDGLRAQLTSAAASDNTEEIEAQQAKARESEANIDLLIDEKFELESEIRKLEAEIGPIKYIAELVYGDTERDTIDDAVRWLIIIFIFVFDPLAVLLLIAANYSFIHRNDHENRQEEIFETLFAKKETPKKTLDKEEEIYDNDKDEQEISTEDEVPYDLNVEKIQEMIKNDDPDLEELEKELERRLNTEKVKRNGWLDDIKKKD